MANKKQEKPQHKTQPKHETHKRPDYEGQEQPTQLRQQDQQSSSETLPEAEFRPIGDIVVEHPRMNAEVTGLDGQMPASLNAALSPQTAQTLAERIAAMPLEELAKLRAKIESGDLGGLLKASPHAGGDLVRLPGGGVSVRVTLSVDLVASLEGWAEEAQKSLEQQIADIAEQAFAGYVFGWNVTEIQQGTTGPVSGSGGTATAKVVTGATNPPPATGVTK